MLNKGFTLIELLVVVLIIAILTVIAVPIFNVAVEKSRAADAITNIKSISKAVEVYRLEHGAYPPVDDWDNLSITMPTGQREPYAAIGGDAWVSPSAQWRYYLYYGNATWANRGPSGANYNLQYSYSDRVFYCQAYRGARFEFFNKVCQSLCGDNPQTESADRTTCKFM